MALEQAIEGGRQHPTAMYGPGPYVYWFLAHHFVAAGVLFADVAPDRDRTTGSDRTGRILVVTARAFVIVDYANAASEPDGDPNQDFGTVTLSLAPRDDAALTAVRWSERSLRIPKDALSGASRRPRLEPGAVTLETASGWTVCLPGETVHDADAYFARLKTALNL